ncbi:MAG: glycoside hydrolase family 57 protein [Bacteroidales bacterium]|nr:glycoside hydrolase family 57 protein [Bacteroidales bacterium]
MKSICLYFQVHQPYRLATYRFFDIGKKDHYFDDYANRYILQQVAEKCYLPANEIILSLIKKYGKDFKVSYSISGIALEQFEQYAPKVIKSFQKLAETGNVEFLAESWAHSLASLTSKKEFTEQVKMHVKKIRELFGQKPFAFRNTELVYSNDIGNMVYDMGFSTMLTEGAKHILGWKSPNLLYCSAANPKLKLLLKNFQLSDDIAFRFSERNWSEWPLTAEKFVGWIEKISPRDEVVNLFMDYETFGEHQWAETGIFEFLRTFPALAIEQAGITFKTPSELSGELQPVSQLNVPHAISWADEERDLTAWLGNELQDEAFRKLYALEPKIRRLKNDGLTRNWRYLQTSDHFYYMCTKWFSDGDVHKYFNPYSSPYDAFVNYMNVLSDLYIRVDQDAAAKKRKSTGK